MPATSAIRRMLIHMTGITETNSTTASAEPRPRLLWPNAVIHIWLAITWVPKLPFVIA